MKLGNDNLRIRGRVRAVTDGRDHVAAASEQMFAIFDAASGTCVHRERESQRALAFSHDGAWLAVGEFHVRVLDVQTFQPRWNVRPAARAAIKAIRWSPDDRILALEYLDQHLVVLNAATGEVIANVARVSWARGVAFRDNGLVWAENAELRTRTFAGDTGELGNAPGIPFAVARDVCVVDRYKVGLIWHAYEGTELAPVATSRHEFMRMSADETCDRVAVVADDVLSLYRRDGNVRTVGKLERRFQTLTLGGRRVVAGDGDGEVTMIDVEDGSRVVAPPGAPSSLAFIADARLACAGEAGAVLRDLSNGDVIAELGPYEHVATAGERILAWGKQGARVFDDMGVSIAELTTIGIQLGTIAFDGVVALAIETLQELMVFDEHGTRVQKHANNGNVVSYSCSSMNPWTRDEPATIDGMMFLTPERLLVFYENGTIEYGGEQRIERPYIPLPKAIVQLDEHVVVGGDSYHRIHRVVDGVVSKEEQFVVRRMRRFAGRGRFIAFGTEAGRIVLYDAPTGQELGSHATHLWEVRAIAIDPTCSLIASSGDDGILIVQALRGLVRSE